MPLLDKFKEKGILFALRAFTNEKYKFRRWFLVKLLKKFLDKYIFEGGESMEEGKSKWTSKTVWAAIITVLVGAIEPISTALGKPIHVPDWVINALIALGLYGIRDAIGKDKPIK